jgi:integrase
MQHENKHTKHIRDGTFTRVIREYLQSAKFMSLAPGTRDHYRRHLEMIEGPDGLGGLSIYELRPALVQAYVDGFSDFPGKQRSIFAVILAVQKWALPRDKLPAHITTGVECLKISGGHRPWTDAQILLAETHAREDISRVVSLMAGTGQRGSDIVRMRWSDIDYEDGQAGINVTQQKTGRVLWVPITPELGRKLSTWERKPPFFLVLGPSGEPYTRPLLSWHWNRHRDTNEALVTLGGMTLHGLRAAKVVNLRKQGYTELQIETLVGMSAPMVKRYCRFADQRSMALAAVRQIRTPSERADTKR